METKTERKPRDYINGKIYCIRNHINDKIYVGSTCQSLSKRMAYHRDDCMKSNRNTLIYNMMRDLGRDNFYIELIEGYPCENSNQLTRREGELMRELKASLNQVIAGRTRGEYKIDNHDKIKQTKAISDKKYAENNQEKLKAYRKKYYNKNPEKFKEDAKKYAEENREAVLAKKREYYYKNRQRILQNVKNYTEEHKEEKRRRDRERYHRKKAEKQSSIEDLD